MRTWILGLCAAGLVALAAPAQALTVDDVIGLTRAKANDAIIMAKIEADGTVFHLTVQEILDLKKAGVSDDVITYMINTGKMDAEPEAMAPEDTTTDIQNVQPEQSGSGDSSDQGYATDLDQSYRGNVSVSFGYYYPHWPGYWYSYYYDPFWWPSLSFYWSYWQPYPYYYAYYDPWYYCNHYNSWYYDSWYYGGIHHHHRYDYAYNYPNHPTRTVKDRNIGNRGPDPGTRVVKGRTGNSPDVRSPGTRSVKPTTPSPGRVIKTERGDLASGGRVMPPQNRRPARIDAQRPERKQVRTQPAPTRRVPEARGRSDRSPRPSREQRRAAPPERRSGKQPEAKAPPARNNRSVERPSRNDNGNQRSYSPPSRSSRSSSHPSRSSSGSRSSGSRTKKGGH